MPWKGRETDGMMLGARRRMGALKSQMLRRKACVVVTVPRILTFNASAQVSGEMVSSGPDGYEVSGTRMKPASFRWCGIAPENATCGRWRYLSKRSTAILVLEG